MILFVEGDAPALLELGPQREIFFDLECFPVEDVHIALLPCQFNQLLVIQDRDSLSKFLLIVVF